MSKICRIKKLEELVTFSGYVPNEELIDLLGRSKSFDFTSFERWYASFNLGRIGCLAASSSQVIFLQINFGQLGIKLVYSLIKIVPN